MKYFTIKELTTSSTATRLKIDNTPTEEVVNNLELLVNNILDKIREAYGKPITVNSGYRCPKLNTAIGGSKTSQHITGKAADITVGNRQANRSLFQFIQKLDLPFDQLIDEYNYKWVHISYDPNRNRKQILHLK